MLTFYGLKDLKILSALKYYLSSIFTLLGNTNFLTIPLVVFNNQVLFKTSRKINLYVSNLMDIWIIKEVILDRCYDKFRKIKKGDVVIDIGASIGDFSILASRLQANIIYSFEIDKSKINLMKKNIKINNSKNILLYQYLVKSLNKLFLDYKINRCDFLKIDCEGNEYQIFKNVSEKTLKKITYIAFEIHLYNKEMEKQYQELKQTLIKTNFFLQELDNPVHSYLKYLFAYR